MSRYDLPRVVYHRVYNVYVKTCLDVNLLGVIQISLEEIDRLRVGWPTRAEDAHGTPSKSHISPSILVYDVYNPPPSG